MNSFLVLVIVILSVLLIGIVLVQKSKGGGLAAGFQSANSTLGAPKTANFLEKASWTIMGIIAALCIICTINTNKFASTTEATPVAAGNQMNMPEGMADEAPVELEEAPAAESAE